MNDWLMTGGILAVLATAWRQVKMVVFYCRSLVIGVVEVHSGAKEAMSAWVIQHSRSPLDVQYYSARDIHMSWWNQTRRVGWRFPGMNGFCRHGRWPIWYSRGSLTGNGSSNGARFQDLPLRFYYLRGTVDMRGLVRDTLEAHNQRTHGYNNGQSRFHVYTYTGRGANTFTAPTAQAESRGGGHLFSKGTADEGSESIDQIQQMDLVNCRAEELSPTPEDRSEGIKRLSLTVEMEDLLRRIDFWLSHREWFLQRGVPWKMGAGFYGPPGCGKTALVRYLAMSRNMPVFAFDLATLHNDELVERWKDVASHTPCIALFDDIDGIFNKRETLAGHLTFDRFINCLDGVEASNGVLTIITTNRPERLDAALGLYEDGVFQPRPGRIDLFIEFTKLTCEGRQHIAQRILVDWPGLQLQVVQDGDGDTGAEFENRCCEVARAQFWAESLLAKSLAVRTTRDAEREFEREYFNHPHVSDEEPCSTSTSAD